MKKLNFLLLLAVICITQACNNNNTQDTVAAAKDSNSVKDSSGTTTGSDSALTTGKSTMPVDKDAADFAVEAANGGMMEVELGNYAQQNASSQRVKDFGAMMVKDHSKANDELKSIAASKNITLPAAVGTKSQKDMEDLMKKKNKDFDKAYISMMLDDHKNDIREFNKAASGCKDPELRSFASKTLPTLQVHLDSVQAILGKK